MKIGILGGTFDPIHEGHLELARAAKKEFGLDRFYFVPAAKPPHKTDREDLTPAPYRYRMVEIALLNQPDFEISDMEFHRPGVSYTVDTLRAFNRKFPRHSLFFVLGADAASGISKWHESKEILKLATVIASPRPGYPGKAPTEGVQYLEKPVSTLSSSDIRQKLAKGIPLSPGTLPAGVEDYIRKMKLYSKAEAS